MNRQAMTARIKEDTLWDVVIIGGGATGLGCAVDAASRGYKTLLIEAYDFCKGTSSKSTKLVHGGVRYLAQGNIKLVTEALRERAYLLNNAPHITRTQGFVIPVYNFFDKLFYAAGLKLYALLAGKLSLGATKLLNKKSTLKHLPGLKDKGLKGGILYFDGQFDDARLAIDLAATAVQEGAAIINYCKAESLVKSNEKIVALVARDALSDEAYTIKSKSFINATGVFSDAVIKMDEPASKLMIAPSQGIHIVIDKHFFDAQEALMIPKTSDGRVLFAVPWHEKVVIGTTDTPVNSIDVEPKPLEEEINFVLQHANKYFLKSITRDDVKSMFAGLRPLIKHGDGKKTAALSRDYLIMISKSGLLTITGGKWTTYRRMAEDAINRIAVQGNLDKKPCITKSLKIKNAAAGLDNLNAAYFVYDDKNIAHFINNEMAQTVEDVLARRTRLLLLDAKQAILIAPAVANIMAELMNEDDKWVTKQVADFTRLARAYLLN